MNNKELIFGLIIIEFFLYKSEEILLLTVFGAKSFKTFIVI